MRYIKLKNGSYKKVGELEYLVHRREQEIELVRLYGSIPVVGKFFLYFLFVN